MKKIIVISILAILFIGTFVFLWGKSQPEVIEYEEVHPSIGTISKSTIVTGKIEDPTGNPVEGIEVTITGQNLCLPRPFEVEALGAVYTDVNGSYYFEVVTHPWSNIQLTTRDIDGPAHGGLFADNGALASPDYRGARLKADDSTWDFGTARLEFPVMTLRYAE